MVKRFLEKDINNNLTNDYILLITGSRQVGKTFLLKKLYKKLKAEGEKVFFITLEDPEILSDLNKHPENIFNYIPKNFQTKLYLLIDEVQYLDNPTNFLKYLYDLYCEHIKIITTGSSAFYLDRKFKDSLAGRKKIFLLKSFSFKEFLIAKNKDDLLSYLKENFFQIRRKIKFFKNIKRELEIYLNEYVKFGGYPRVVLEDDIEEKKFILKELYTSFLKKDIFESGIKNQDSFYKLIKILSYQTGNLVNINELSKTLGLSFDTVKNYIYVLEKSFIIKLIKPFSKNIRKELTKMQKIFFYDLGYRNALYGKFENLSDNVNTGNFLENIFFRLLIDNNIEDIRFWRNQNKREVDFIIDEKYAFEIKLKPETANIKKYKKFIETYPEIEFYFVGLKSEEYLDIYDFL
jgi:predicted AAA+ superfamily ATPase